MPNNHSTTVSQAIVYGQQELQHIDDSLTIIYSLLSHTTSLSKEQLWQYPDNIITHPTFAKYKQLIARAREREPLAYILGYADFYDLQFTVTQDTLIPRPESENIVEAVLRMSPQPTTIVDVGTGSGCLGLTLADHLPYSHIYAIDVSPAALKVASRNTKRLNIPNVTIFEGSLLGPLAGVVEPGSVDVIVANLPYISDDEYSSLPATIKEFEPAVALRSGADPDVLNRQLIDQSKQWLRPTGVLFYETTNGRIVRI